MSYRGHIGKQGWPGMSKDGVVPEGWELDPTQDPINGVLRPLPSNSAWNDWAAENPQPEAKALAEVLPLTETVLPSLKGMLYGAKPVDK